MARAVGDVVSYRVTAADITAWGAAAASLTAGDVICAVLLVGGNLQPILPQTVATPAAVAPLAGRSAGSGPGTYT